MVSTMYVTSTMTSPVTKTAKTSKWLRLEIWLNIDGTYGTEISCESHANPFS